MTVIGASAPPTSLQLAISPVKIFFRSSSLMSSMVTSALTIGAMPTMHTLLSAILEMSEESFSLDSANTSELPICTAPCAICVTP